MPDLLEARHAAVFCIESFEIFFFLVWLPAKPPA
jgi:hypothetical protein